ncbi:protein FAM53B isoform X2 [Grus americana]|uniref:protein FAM53B isoform X2 n=1 Tax=Grus americana TaxID=9117 RepID=UPI0024078B6E|nr:protein FAM53B isoform X2 [Grus americana]
MPLPKRNAGKTEENAGVGFFAKSNRWAQCVSVMSYNSGATSHRGPRQDCRSPALLLSPRPCHQESLSASERGRAAPRESGCTRARAGLRDRCEGANAKRSAVPAAGPPSFNARSLPGLAFFKLFLVCGPPSPPPSSALCCGRCLTLGMPAEGGGRGSFLPLTSHRHLRYAAPRRCLPPRRTARGGGSAGLRRCGPGPASAGPAQEVTSAFPPPSLPPSLSPSARPARSTAAAAAAAGAGLGEAPRAGPAGPRRRHHDFNQMWQKAPDARSGRGVQSTEAIPSLLEIPDLSSPWSHLPHASVICCAVQEPGDVPLPSSCQGGKGKVTASTIFFELRC